VPKYRIARVADSEEMHGIHKMAFGGDPWPGDEHEFWVVYDQHNAVAGFASALELRVGTGYLSRSAVVIQHRGRGLHQRLIKAREKWLKDCGVTLVVTHVEQYNYASLVALLRMGYRLVERNQCPRGYDRFHLLYKGDPTYLKQALADMDAETDPR
jgi:RimJ/RimL family protein N-acetyltransferase